MEQMADLYSQRAQRQMAQERYFYPVEGPPPSGPAPFDLTWGLPDPETYPVELIRSLTSRMLEREGAVALDYYDEPKGNWEETTYGYTGLRDEVIKFLHKREGRSIERKGILMAHGSVHGLDLTLRAYVSAGDSVYVESASYAGAVRHLQVLGADIVRIPLDDDGMRIDLLEEQLASAPRLGTKPKMVYTVSDFGPNGQCLSLERRRQLLELARKYHMIVLEDSAYSDLRFEGERIPSLFSLDDSGLVLQSGTFSKMVAPGIRMGWIAGTPESVRPITFVRNDIGDGQFSARILAEYMTGGHLEPHLERVRRIYRAKRDTIIGGLRQYSGDYVSFFVPQGAFFLAIELAEEIDSRRARINLVENRVWLRPGENVMGTDDPRSVRFLRLAYGRPPIDRLREVAPLIGQALELSQVASVR